MQQQRPQSRRQGQAAETEAKNNNDDDDNKSCRKIRFGRRQESEPRFAVLLPPSSSEKGFSWFAVRVRKRRFRFRISYTTHLLFPPLSIAPFPSFRQARTLLALIWVSFVAYTFVILFGEAALVRLGSQQREQQWWCPYRGRTRRYPNPDSTASDACYYYRSAWLLGLNAFECDFGRRVVASLLLGSCIGYERKAADRPAGIRTMSLVCLASCLFTMCGQFAFRATTQEWDSARVSAAVPSGVGFLGSALIWKETSGQKGTKFEQHSVHGLTTAASIWLSASVGIGVGGGLYLYCCWAVVLVLFVLRLGPQLVLFDPDVAEDDSSFEDEEEDATTADAMTTGSEERWGTTTDDYDDEDDYGYEPRPLTRQEQLARLREEAAVAAAVASSSTAATATAVGLDDSAIGYPLLEDDDEGTAELLPLEDLETPLEGGYGSVVSLQQRLTPAAATATAPGTAQQRQTGVDGGIGGIGDSGHSFPFMSSSSSHRRRQNRRPGSSSSTGNMRKSRSGVSFRS